MFLLFSRVRTYAHSQLMAKNDLAKLGYYGDGGEDARQAARQRGDVHASEARHQNKRGFVAGVPAAPKASS